MSLSVQIRRPVLYSFNWRN